MSQRIYHRLIWILLSLVMLSSCSGGESGTGFQEIRTTVGKITGFGSIYVNGIHFNTDQVNVEIDGVENSAETDLQIGMIVKVVGSVSASGSDGVASHVYMSTGIEGLVFDNSFLSDNSLNVMGQIVHINNDTLFDSSISGINNFQDLIAGDTVVEVHGFTDGQGDFFATLVKVVETGGVATEVKIRGVIQGLTGTTVGSTFMIGAITVQFDGTTSLKDGLLLTDLHNGLYVEVKSTSYSGIGSVVLAAEIELENHSEAEGTGYELEGIVTDITNIGSSEFSVNGQRIIFDLTTVFDGGTSLDIALGIELEVKGVFQADGSIRASEISFHAESNMQAEGLVTSIDFASNSFTIDGPVTITVNGLTSYEDDVDDMNHTFNFDQITIGMQIRARYYLNSSMQNIATLVERRG